MQNELGIDTQQVSAWISSLDNGLKGPFGFELISGGRSNLTFRVTDSQGRSVILRRPPVAHVLSTAHDMAREFKIISALNQVDYLVPETWALCEDPDVTGATFYLMDFVDGHILRNPESVSGLGQDFRQAVSRSLIENLVRLHEIDPDTIGLGDLARKDSYVARQLKRWSSQFVISQQLTGRSVQSVSKAYEILSSKIPEQTKAAIVHGDYRLDNCVFSNSGQLLAVLDWELCTLGDPLADVGLLMVYWAEPGDPITALEAAATVDGGFLSRTEMAQIYSDLARVDLASLDYYVAFGYWKLACILEGVYSRYSHGAQAGDRSDFEIYADQVDILASRALEILD